MTKRLINHVMSGKAVFCWCRYRLVLVCVGAAIIVLPSLVATAEPNNLLDDMRLGLALSHQGKYPAALRVLTRAEQTSRKGRNARHQARILLLRSEVYEKLGYQSRALDDAENAQGIASKHRLKKTSSIALGAIARISFTRGDRLASENSMSKAFQLAKDLRDGQLMADLLNTQGVLLLGVDEAGKALPYFKKAVATARNNSTRVQTVLYLANLADAYSRLEGQGEQARQAIQNAFRLSTRARSAASQMPLLARIGALAFKISTNSGSVDTASTSKKAFTQLSQQAGVAQSPRYRSMAYGYLGLLAERQGRNKQAQYLATAALLAVERQKVSELAYKWHWLLGRLRRAVNDLPGARAHYERTISLINDLRSDMASDPHLSNRAFLDILDPVFRQYAEILLVQAKSSSFSKAQRKEGLGKARNVIEILKSVELEDYFGDRCVTTLKSKEVSIDRLPAGTAALYPIILENRLELILSLPDGQLQQWTINITRLELEKEINAFRSKLVNRISYGFMAHSKKLYSLIIRPVEKALSQNRIKTIVFIPDGLLRTIPIAALNSNGTLEGYLIKRYEVAIAPSLTLINPQNFERKKPTILALGLSEAEQGFSPLPSVATELDDLESLFQTPAIRNQSFTVKRVRDEFKATSFRIVHIATHAEFFPDPSRSFLLTHKGRLTMSDLEQLIKFGRFRDQPVELLTLSACRTAAGNDRAALGLAGIAVKSGARSTLATLWYINDYATSILISEFYRRLRQTDNSITKAALLRQAQLKLLDDQNTRHPSFWAPFLMIGNWQ